MKITGIVGSPNGLKGNTGKLMMEILGACEAAGAQVEAVTLPGGTVQPCTACHVCHVKGACPIKDEFEPLRAKLLASDGIVLATPNYIDGVSAQLKAFLDRCGCVLHILQFEGKYGAAAMTSGGEADTSVTDYLQKFLTHTGVAPVGAIGVSMAGMPGEGEFTPEVRAGAAELGRSLVASITAKRGMPPAAELEFGAFKERMRNLMLWRRDVWPFEYDYWVKNHGLAQ